MIPTKTAVQAFLAAWMVPGLGHWMLGKRNKAIFFFAVITVMYLFGQWICEFRHVRFQDNPFHFFGRFGSGTMLGISLTSDIPAHPREDLPPLWFDYGLLYANVAGLLNLIVSLNIWTLYIDSRKLRESIATSAEPMKVQTDSPPTTPGEGKEEAKQP